MALPQRTKKYLDKKMARYELLTHKTVYTAYDAAQTLKKELHEIAKSLLIATDKAYIVAVIPANMRLDLAKLKKALKAKKVSIPTEKIIVKQLKFKPGSLTAFGGLHQLETWVDKSLMKTKDVILAAGSFTDSVRMKAKDFIDLEQARLASFAKSGGDKPPKKTAKKKKVRPTKKNPAKRKTTKRPTFKKKITKRKTAKKSR